jgi:multiple sugar transport system ATP-binding protein
MSSSPLTITNLVKSYGEKTVLDDISFAAEPGQFIVLVGPSGCGKSTLLRSVAGLESVSSGAISIGGRDVTHLAPKDRDIAMVFQDYALYPHKTVYENIAFGLRIRKTPEAKIDQLVKEAAAKLDLLPYLQRRPAALSGGQRQRVAIGRAIVRNPQIFLFDEPLSNLDAKLRGSMRISIAKLHKELSATVLYVTHDQIEAMTLADKIIVLEGGHIQQMGAPLDLYYHPSNVFVATFIGSPSMNLLEGRLEDKNGALSFVSVEGMVFPVPEEFRQKLKGRHTGQDVIWGIRPENMRVAGDNPTGPVFKARTVVTELHGPSSAVVCDIAGHEVTVMLPAPHRPRRNEILNLEFRSKHLYIFDKKTQESLID